MAKLIHVTNVSLTATSRTNAALFDLFTPHDDVFASATDLLRSVGNVRVIT